MPNGAERLVTALVNAGVECVFGLPGTQTVELFEALRHSPIRVVQATNELAAAFMAGGWARATGRPGVVITIPGPGFTWALTGLAEAALDSVPLVMIAGSPPPASGRRFQQQELDQAAVARPLVKAVLNGTDPTTLGQLATRALRTAASEEPGPVLLHVSSAAFAGDAPPIASEPEELGPPADLIPIRARFEAARRPVLLVGQGIFEAAGSLATLAERLGAPVVTTPSGRGALPEDHPLAIGFDGLAGNLHELNRLFDAADLILAVGAKLGHNGTCGYRLRLALERLVHVDQSAGVLNANYPASVAAVAGATEVLAALLDPPLPRSEWSPTEVNEWKTRIRSEQPLVEPKVGGRATTDPAGFFSALRRTLPRETIVVLDSGFHQILTRRHYPVLAPRGLLFPSDLQSMGFSLPTAIGARLAERSRPVVAIMGDGGFAMTGLELLTAVREKIDLVVVVFVDGYLGQIRMQQLANFGTGYAVELHNPDFEGLAAAIGARYFLIESDPEATLRAALQAHGVSIVEVPVGDSLAIRRTAAVAKAREVTRRVAGPSVIGWIKRLLRR
jgi:acetolactate synthase-1/2/3 large subunit